MKLNLGCGNTRKERYIGVDIAKKGTADIVCDLNKAMPFRYNSIEEIYMSHVLEHLDDPVKTMEELYRILAPGGMLKLVLPFPSAAIAKNMLHRHGFMPNDFAMFDRESNKAFLLKTTAYFRTKKIRFLPHIPAMLFPFWLYEKLGLFIMNLCPRFTSYYISWFFPLEHYEVTLVKK